MIKDPEPWGHSIVTFHNVSKCSFLKVGTPLQLTSESSQGVICNVYSMCLRCRDHWYYVLDIVLVVMFVVDCFNGLRCGKFGWVFEKWTSTSLFYGSLCSSEVCTAKGLLKLHGQIPNINHNILTDINCNMQQHPNWLGLCIAQKDDRFKFK